MSTSFNIKIEDKYQRSYIDYDGISLSYEYGGKGSDGISPDLKQEDINNIINLCEPLVDYTNKNGFNKPISFTADTKIIAVGKQLFDADKKYVENDENAIDMASRIQAYIFEKYPEVEKLHDESIYRIKQEEDALEREQEDIFNDLSINTLKEKYPSLFDENGEFKKESIKLIMSLIDEYAPQIENNGPQK